MFQIVRLGLAILLAAGGVGSLFSDPQVEALGRGIPTRTPTPVSAAGCTSDVALCLDANRFLVTAEWARPDGSSGWGHPVALTADSGYFWFAEPGNVELTVKALDGCGVNGFRWFFAAGLTNLWVRITVADLTDGSRRVYTNEQGSPFHTITDTAAFTTCAGELAPERANREEPSAEDVATDDTELLLQGRFRVEADWETASGRTGAAHAVPISEESGYFWFFDPGNVELVVKILDACAIHSGNWFFGAGMTRVGVRLRVTDTVSEEVRTYSSPVNAPFASIQDTSAFAGCPTPTPTATAISTATPTPEPGQTQNVNVYCRLYCIFFPSTLHVRVGDTVRWHLRAPLRGFHSTVADHGEWDSGPPGAYTFDHAFRSPGRFPYHCSGEESHLPGEIIVDPWPASAERPVVSTPTPTWTPHLGPRLTKTPTPVTSPSRTPTPTQTRTHVPTQTSTVSPTRTPTPGPQTHTVIVVELLRNFYAFAPSELHVHVGDTVHWSLVGPHGGLHRTASRDGLWDSGRAVSFNYTFTFPGTFQYLCGLDGHTWGTIVVDP